MKLTTIAALLLIPATAFAWKPVEPSMATSPKKGGFSVQLPAGWLYDTSGAGVLASRDGIFLEQISVRLVPHKDAFKQIKKTSAPDALPEDLAESYVANLQAPSPLSTIQDVEVISTEPAELAGLPAFRLHLRYRLSEQISGAGMEEITVGAPLAGGLLLATYVAPSLHYFPKWQPTYEETLKTIAVSP